MGQPMPAVVAAKDDQTITFDLNHEMAGKALTFEIELLSAE
jgi:FKBP-type peptidyl-prolyl cis-trans isomerase 2